MFELKVWAGGKIAAKAVKMGADRRLTEAGGYTKI
jgi:hypothetical protein